MEKNRKYLIALIYIGALLFSYFYRSYGIPIFIIIFFIIIGLVPSSYQSENLQELKNINYKKFIVISIPFGVLSLLFISINNNPYTHIMMIGDAVPHIQWARAFANFHNFNIAAFSWDPAPEKYINDGVFGVETSKLSAHVLYYYGYYLVGLVAAYFYKAYSFDGHHVLFVAAGFYFLTAVIFYSLTKLYKFNSYVLLVLVFSWCINPFSVSAIVDGGKFEVILFPIYLGFLIAVVRRRCVLGVSLALILIFTSSSYAYFLLGTLPLVVYIWWGLKMRFLIAIGVTAIVVLITSHFLYLNEVERIAQGSISSVPVPNLASSKEKLFNALKFNFNLALSYLIFTFAGLISRFNLNKNFFSQKKIICLLAFLIAGIIFVSLRSYGYSFHRNILIFAPIFVFLLELIENFNCKILGNKIQLVGILFVAIFVMVRPATDGWIYIKNNFYLSEIDKEIVRDISSCSRYIDEIAKPYSKISIDVNRSLEGAFLHEPNYWRYIFMPFDVNLVIYVKILRGDFQDYDYSETKDIFIASKPLHGYFKNKSCEVKIYKVNE